MAAKFKINRAPVLTLWATVVAERLGYDEAAALTLGRAVAGLNAQSKGRRLGIYEPKEEKKGEEKPKKPVEGEVVYASLLGRLVEAVQTRDGLRALDKDKPSNPQAVRRYLENKFGENLGDAEAAMRALAKAFPPEELKDRAYLLYEKFRPEIPEGVRGWGAAGDLDLEKLRSLAK